MKASEFFKKFGIGEAKALVKAQSWTMRQIALSTTVDTKELTRIVESHELIESCGGLDKAKKKLSTEQSEPYYNYSQRLVDSLKQAIADVESCQ